jgi:hypothetical protein
LERFPVNKDHLMSVSGTVGKARSAVHRVSGATLPKGRILSPATGRMNMKNN